jgi:hypothetical protein
VDTFTLIKPQGRIKGVHPHGLGACALKMQFNPRRGFVPE